MAEYFGSDFIYGELTGNSEITDIVGTAIYSARLIPESENSLKTINFYTIGNFDGALEYFEREWSIDCRSNNEQESKNIAFLVYENLNRYHATVSGKAYFSVCSILSTIEPLNDSDVYNTPVSMLLKRR